MYQNLLHLTDELCINATGKSNTKKALGACRKTHGKLRLALLEGISWVYNFFVISSDSSSEIDIDGRGYWKEGQTMEQRVCQINLFGRYPW
jgi:hypothetical protein